MPYALLKINLKMGKSLNLSSFKELEKIFCIRRRKKKVLGDYEILKAFWAIHG
jgi:hypothetical protein